METLSIKFTDTVIFIKNERQRIMNAPQLEDKIAEYKQVGDHLLFNARTKFQRNRRFLSQEKEPVANLAISLSSPIGQVIGWLKEKSRQFVSGVIPGIYPCAPEISTPIYEMPRFKQLEHNKSERGKNKHSSFVRDDQSNHWTDSLYLLRYVLHYLGWSAFVNRVNQAETTLAALHAESDRLDFIEQRVKKALASNDGVLASYNRNEAVLDADRSRSAVQAERLLTTRWWDNRGCFFSQSSAQNDSRMQVTPGSCSLMREN